MIEAPLEIQAQRLNITSQHYDACVSQGLPITGNAAGNSLDWMNLQGENTSPSPLPTGFAARGIVALVFSCISAFLGLAVISWWVPEYTSDD